MIEVNERFSITQDKYNTIVLETIPTNPDNPRTKNATKVEKKFYPTIELACLAILRKTPEAKSVKKLLKGYNKAVRDIKDALATHSLGDTNG